MMINHNRSFENFKKLISVGGGFMMAHCFIPLSTPTDVIFNDTTEAPDMSIINRLM